MTIRRDLSAGDAVELFSRFSDSWVAGFEIAMITGEGFRVRRNSDGALLPVVTSPADVRLAN